RPAAPHREGSLVKEWPFQRGTDDWSAWSQCTAEAREGALVVTPKGDRPQIGTYIFVAPPRGDYVLKFRARMELGGRAAASWLSAEGEKFEARRGARVQLEPGPPREYAVELTSNGGPLAHVWGRAVRAVGPAREQMPVFQGSAPEMDPFQSQK